MEETSGIIVRYQSGFYSVETSLGRIICTLRGRLKQGTTRKDIAAIGDRVTITVQMDSSGVIEKLEERTSSLVRSAPSSRGEYQQVLIANLDQVVIVFACDEPPPHLRMLDRFLVICERQELKPLIIANKVDLVGRSAAKKIFEPYLSLEYPILFTSVKKHLGINKLEHYLKGKISCFTGPSGVGKTSLLNALQPNLGLHVREISQATFKGKHTTVVRELFPLAEGGFVADMPGLRTLGLWDIEPEEIDAYFPEMRYLVADCQFSNCSHQSEPGCAIRAAVESGKIHPLRYDSYMRLRAGDE